jgi:hypothetical protein
MDAALDITSIIADECRSGKQQTHDPNPKSEIRNSKRADAGDSVSVIRALNLEIVSDLVL